MPNNFPHDITIDILLKLPVKSLLRFKPVCKSWCSQIEDRQFIMQHRDRCQNDINCHKIFLACWNRWDHCDYYSIDAPLQHDSVVSHLELPLFPDINHSFSALYSNTCVFVNSCNGLFLLVFSSVNIALWNPTIKESRRIPSPISNDGKEELYNRDFYG
uniref:F-box protein At3g16210 n=1 Tax=Nicotiana sylvestris TaxID=4096 RepID=A0A1U7X9Q9_NICSY|nr:PREDICTED: putative F-box protein At3g16210 [Nicotiana sylvestris]